LDAFDERSYLMFSAIGPVQLLIILLIVLAIFGGKRLRTLGSDIGTGLRGFRNSISETESEADEGRLE
jgi:sec-independent protein translocase protein TatA